MKTIAFDVAGHRYEYQVPESWAELTTEQFKAWVRHGGELGAALSIDLLGMDAVVALNLLPADWWVVNHELEWMTDTEGIRTLYIDELTMPDGTVFYGYNADWSDVTWEEWMFAENYAAAGHWEVVAAVLYRPERTDWNRESDRRIPFTKYGTEKRMEQTAKLDTDTLRAIEVNYKFLRKRMTDNCVHLFHEPAEDEGKGQNMRKRRKSTDWLSIIRNMMGDNFYEEQKYLQLSVPSVLYQLEQRVKEAQKHGN